MTEMLEKPTQLEAVEADSNSPNDFTNDLDRPETAVEDSPILPRSAWSSQLAQLRILLKAKQVLDQLYYPGNSSQ
ncbi:hypothetical protein HJG54_14370 [Leptolyngbya sp. NK1-12]|uniref:Uncharacterized protein n=1 Tax=Leptolyngbya sp. NK1-12 TaxID=2547451 RepID=A0AA97AEP4_9CYAN|nr:hypothetical protein [Leptolyngbya sp. NK1-12]WNZ21389.1 hypothetical protein HJG54_14370 [Leptolyngbya sp. NK1-12]